VPHYKAAFDARGVHPSDCRSLADLAKFPFTAKADLRANYPFGMFAVPRERVVRIHASSGTTGKPTVVGYTAGDIDRWAQLGRARSAPRAGAPATSCTWPTATACSPAAWARTTAPSGWAAPWCRWAAARPRSRCS
jgi:phenylacetate-coenzyme A ligase PaaK-like adenylate-forming protein